MVGAPEDEPNHPAESGEADQSTDNPEREHRFHHALHLALHHVFEFFHRILLVFCGYLPVGRHN